jgi:ssDNA-binding Zn-finger/Zn-ribbon topoisomerase 1
MQRCPTCNEPMMLRKNQTDYKCMYCQQTVKPECELTQVIAIQPELSQPDAEGWWWRNGVRPKCYYLITGKPSISLPGYMEYQDECDCIGRVLIKGSWIKAIVPEFKEDN